MLTIDPGSVSFNKEKVLNITMPIRFAAGDRIGIIGANGAGKSTLIKSCLGLVPYTGKIQSVIRPEQMAVHMQMNNYTELMSVQHIIEAILNRKIKKDQKLQEMIAFFNFENSLKKRYKSLSGGQKQRLTLIMVLLQDAPITFFDEVTSGLDFETRQQLMQKIRAWYQDKPATICLVSHYYEELEQLANKILILEKGEVIDFDSKENLFAKYCGYSVIILEKNPEYQQLVQGLPVIHGPEHLLVLTCRDTQEENHIMQRLTAANINFKRSNNDIEIMSVNAIQSVLGGAYNE